MIDLFIIPIVNAFKDEAKRTIQTLIALGVSAERIKVVFNKIPSEMDYNIETDMAWIFDFHKKNPHFNLDKEAIIFDSPAFGILDEVNKKLGLSFENMLNDTNDYLQIMRDTSDEKARIAAVAMMRAQGYAKSVNRALKPVFSLLVGA